MTPSRLLRILLFISGSLAFILLAYYVTQRPSQMSSPFARSVDKAERLTLQTGPSRIELDRDGMSWMVSASSAPGRYKADPDKIKTLQASLRNITLEDVISTRPDRAADFEVNAESAALVALYAKNGSLLAEGLVGKQAPDFTHLYFKYPGRPEVYLARGAIRGELGVPDLKTWRDRTLLNVAENQVTALVLETSDFKTLLARSSDTWSCNGQVIDPATVWGLLGTLAHLKADDFVDLTQRPDLTASSLKYASVTLQLRDGGSRTLHIGRPDPGTKLTPVAADGDPTAAWVSEGVLKAILRKPGDFKPAVSSRGEHP